MDNIIILAGSKVYAEKFENDLEGHFKIKWLYQPNFILGIGINFDDDGSIALTQSYYVSVLLACFVLTDANMVSTLLDSHIKLNLIDLDQAQSTVPRIM